MKSPFTDIDGQTKEAYDAITALWELGVASGISDTSYAPGASITRAAMAEFMVGVLDHSNARPAGVTIQADKTWAFDAFDAKIAVSYRDDMFMPMVDVSIKTFHNNSDGTTDGVGAFTEDGDCDPATACAWTDDEALTDDSGNLYVDGGVVDGKTNTYYAWMGDPDADDNDFNVNESPHASVTLSSTRDATALKVTSDISGNSTGDNTVDLDTTSSVTHTVQLVDGSGDPVARSGVKIGVTWEQDLAAVDGGTDPEEVEVYPAPADLVTDDDGQATFTTSGPTSTKDTDAERVDTITFTAKDDDITAPVERMIQWRDTDPTTTTAVRSAPAYVLRASGKVTVRASVTLYDQYGNTIGKGFQVNINIGGQGAETRTVSSRGVATWRETIEVADADLGTDITIAVSDVVGLPDPENSDQRPALSPTFAGPESVEVVEHAEDDSSLAATDNNVTAVYADDNRFLIGNDLYTYDSDDVFVDDTPAAGQTAGDGDIVDMDKFESLLGANLEEIDVTATVQIIVYDDDGSSIFRVQTAAVDNP